MRFIEIASGHFIRTDVIAVVQFRREKGGGLMATVVTTVPTAQGAVRYDVHDAEAVAALETLIVEPPLPSPRGMAR